MMILFEALKRILIYADPEVTNSFSVVLIFTG